MDRCVELFDASITKNSRIQKIIMSEIARPLLEEEQISSFLSAIDFESYFSDKNNLKRVFNNVTDVGIAFAQSITLIKDANNDLLDVVENNTLDSKKH